MFSVDGNPPELDSVISPPLQGTLRSLRLRPSAQEGLSSHGGLRLCRRQAAERTYFRKTRIHLPLSEESRLIEKLFSVSLFSYLLNWLKLELMAEPASWLLLCVSWGNPHSNFGLIKGSANQPPHSDPHSKRQTQECAAHGLQAWLPLVSPFLPQQSTPWPPHPHCMLPSCCVSTCLGLGQPTPAPTPGTLQALDTLCPSPHC